jgi:hypothetical protein
MALWSKVLSFFAGEAAGAASGDVLKPAFEPTKQNAWARRPYRVLDPTTAAEADAQRFTTSQVFRSLDESGGVVAESDWPATDVDLADDALREGIGPARWEVLRRMARKVPPFPEALTLHRRGRIDEATVNSILAREGIPPGLWPALRSLKLDLLDLGQLAAAIHRGLIPDPGLLKGEQPKAPFNVEAYPVYPIDALDEAAGSGYDRDRLGVLVGLQGLPMGVIEAAQAFYRRIITYGDYIRAFNESNNRNEWAGAVLEYARQIPTARDFFENALRGYHSLAWAQKQAERHGMTPEDSLVIYQNQGRPMNIRQITQALSRGGVFNPEPGELTDPYKASIVEGNVKPAYYDLAESLKYTLPSPFVMRQLTASGVWSEAKAAKRLKDAGWIPQDADEAAAAWAGGTGTTTDPHVAKAEVQLWGTLHRSYIADESDETIAAAKLTELGVPAAAQTRILALWEHERELRRKQLTPAQVKKAWVKLVTNPATGVAWTRDDALAALVDRGYNMADATTFLET